LSLAVSKADASMVALLLARGADPHAKDKAGRPLIYAAIRGGDPQVVQLLADAGTDLETSG
jgi:ankyrin repeat protein